MTKTIEFEAELTGGGALTIPPEVVSALPTEGRVKVLFLVEVDSEDAEWRKAAYGRFLSDDSVEDAVEVGPTQEITHGQG
jgi:hypothetical protein